MGANKQKSKSVWKLSLGVKNFRSDDCHVEMIRKD